MRPGQNAIESYKTSKQGDGLCIREDLPRIIREGHQALSPADKELLKWVGVFFRKPTPGRFMMRIRMPNGFAYGRQLRAIADLSRRLGNLIVDITTRQQLQLRGFILDSIPEIWERLRGVELRTLQTDQDNVRNLNGCALAGLTANELFVHRCRSLRYSWRQSGISISTGPGHGREEPTGARARSRPQCRDGLVGETAIG